MSEEKIIQHSANALHVLRDKEKGWSKKIREFFGEILIIVFAVSITLVLHNWNDERHERRMAREFLAGIKNDLDSGAADLEGSIGVFQPTIDFYIKTRQQIATSRFDTAYLDANSWAFGNTAYFVFDMSRFEGFKSSGYLRLIENQTLLQHLMSLYTISIPFQINADKGTFDKGRQYIDEHIGPKASYNLDSSSGFDKIQFGKLVDDPFFRYYIIEYSFSLQERKGQKQDLIREMKKMSAEIAAELEK